MEKQNVTLVTAFFDIGRGSIKGVQRSNSKYLDYFRFWARIKNKLIVYTDSTTAKEVLKIRKNYNLEKETIIVKIEDVTKCESEIYSKLVQVSNSKDFLDYRYIPNQMDNNALYDYIMLMKTWCLNDAVEKKYAKGMMAWIDFGFNHGDELYYNEKEFDFDLNVELPTDKITLFSNNLDNGKPIFRIVQSYEVFIMGAIYFIPSTLAKTLWEDTKLAMISLLNVGFMDDDQTLLLMATRMNPSKYNVVESDWMLPLKQFGGEHLSIKEKKLQKSSMIKKALKLYRHLKRNYKCKKRYKKLFLKEYR